MFPQVLFYTCANSKYEDFVPLYVASALWSVPMAVVEVGLESVEAYSENNPNALAVLEEHFPGRFKLTNVPWERLGRPVIPNTVRFVIEPDTKAANVYIGDIDIIYLDGNMPNEHLEFMARSGLSYANMFRANTNRLTGLHFSTWSGMYPLPDIDDLDLSLVNDEEVLALISDRKGHERTKEKFRPVPGIHVSPNRPPISFEGKPNWGILPWRSQYEAFRETDLFQALRLTLKGVALETIDAVDNAILELERHAISSVA